MILLNQNQLAAKLKVTKGRISQLKKEGRLDQAMATDPISKRLKFDYNKVFEILSKTEDNTQLNQNEVLNLNLNYLEDDDNEDDSESLDDSKVESINDNETYDQARAKKMRYAAELERLEYEQTKGNLIAIEQIEKEAFECAKNTREALTNIPDRLAPQLAATNDEFEIHKILSNEINKILMELSK